MSQIASIRLRVGRVLRPWLAYRQIQSVLDGGVAAAAMLVAYLLRFDFVLDHALRRPVFFWIAVAAVLYPLSLALSKGHRSRWRFFSLRDLGSLVVRGIPALIVLLVVRAVLHFSSYLPYSVALLWFGVTVCLSSALRIARRLDHEAVLRSLRGTKRTLLVGTEESLASAIRQLSVFGEWQIAGLVCDTAKGMKIAGLRVLGELDDIPHLVQSRRIEAVFASTADLASIADLIEICTAINVDFRLLPSASDVAMDRVRVINHVSPLTIHRRSTPEATELHADVLRVLSGQIALVTGAGGSIGSELARQIISTPVQTLIVVDQDENSIFELMNEIGKLGNIIPYIADIRNVEAMESIFRQHKPDVVFHAAAYKHVPLMEQNPCEAVITNVFGTRVVAQAAMQAGVQRFVLISTDKAVKPSSIMGASKRLAEMTVQDFAANGRGSTQFACVRFGNVLGSRGSVLPIFLKQIAAGGPITVTNAEMTRYFMTIPQAVRLVLKAATLASNGDIYMLDMGDPVRIMDFAREVIHASGLVVDRDIEIKVTGTRPGEKLHEQLWNDGATVTVTDFDKVFRVHASAVPRNFDTELDSLLEKARDRRTEDVRRMLQTMPVDYDEGRAYVEKLQLAV